MTKNINEMTMAEILQRAVELGFKIRKTKNPPNYLHWNYSQECKAYQFVLKNDPELQNDSDDFPDDAA